MSLGSSTLFRRPRQRLLGVIALFALLLPLGFSSQSSSSFETLHSWVLGAEQPQSPLLRGADGRLYGTTSQGGSSNRGTVYALAADGSDYTVLHSFDYADGAQPYAGLIQGADGRLYGTTSQGGSSNLGTVYALAADGSGYTVLHDFDVAHGANPQAGLIQGADGRLYGTTFLGGSSGYGTVYALAADGSGYSVLHNFEGAHGATPPAGLIQGADGRLYGTTFQGGNSDAGTVYALAPDGSGYTVLHSFDGANGSSPQAGLIQGADGRMYGTASEGGSSNAGAVYALAADGRGYSVLHSFDGDNGSSPQAGLVQGTDGRLYGTTLY
ncbi:MAG: hypothetical protein PHT19_10740, partial [Methylococcus sp.]|nr:hypothetical protein [Methylococcus sp.]